MSETAIQRIAGFHDALTAIRRDIHAHPEPGLEERRTAALVAAELRSYGVEVTEGVGGTGVVGTLKGRLPGQRAIGLRADMDCLFLTERTGVAHASTRPGLMHACGHDGHTTMLLGAARALAERPDFGGTVHFIFQPAEEGRGGARAMLADGLFERFACDAIYGMHNWPGLAAGKFAIRKGPLLAAADRFRVVFGGTGGHGGAAPHLASDLTIVLAEYISALQTIAARSVPAIEAAVVSVGYVVGGDPESANVMPSRIELGGTTRSFRPAVRDTIERRIGELAHGIAALHGATAEVSYLRGDGALVNAAEQTDVAVAAAEALVGRAAVNANTPAITGGEDFTNMLARVPGAFIFIGNGTRDDGAHGAGLHTPDYDFNDAILPVGAAWYVGVVAEELGPVKA
jgi:hippurate hydrolase